MSAGKANCLICGEAIVYSEEARDVECVICHKHETGHSVCKDGHYVCDACHRAQGVEFIIKLCSETPSKDPAEIMVQAMNDNSVYPNGPEHHTLVGAAMLAAYCNAGGELDLAKALDELTARSLQVPGGTCGFWGCCGAAVSAGQAMSIINGSTPMTRQPWAQCQRLTSDILGKLADLGGPRCCKRCGFTALETAVPSLAEVTGVQMELPARIVCTFADRNAECLRERCPYSPLHP